MDLQQASEAQLLSALNEITKSFHVINDFVINSSIYSTDGSGYQVTGYYTQKLIEGIAGILETCKSLIVIENVEKYRHSDLKAVYTEAAKYKGLFNSLNIIISMIKDGELIGCQILSVVYQFVISGDEIVHTSVNRIFSDLNKLFIYQVRVWLLHGDLWDAHGEFFIERCETEVPKDNSTPSTSSAGATVRAQAMGRSDEYRIRHDRIPYYIPENVIEDILYTGRIVNRMLNHPSRQKLLDSINSDLYGLGADDYSSGPTVFDEGDEAGFKEVFHILKEADVLHLPNFILLVSEIKESANMNLWRLLVGEGKFLPELHLIKYFFLLGREDLFIELLRFGGHVLDGPLTETSARDMNQAFRSAAEETLMDNNPDIAKFTFEMQYTNNESEPITSDSDIRPFVDGWTNMILTYNFKWPQTEILTPEVLTLYSNMFKFLLRIRKTQEDLNYLWRTYKTRTHFLMNKLHTNLMSFMDNLMLYFQEDVIDTHYATLLSIVTNATDYETVKKAHSTFYKSVLTETFYTVFKDEDEEVFNPNPSSHNPIMTSFIDMTKVCDAFCTMMGSAADETYQQESVAGYTERYRQVAGALFRLLRTAPTDCGVDAARLLARLSTLQEFQQEHDDDF